MDDYKGWPLHFLAKSDHFYREFLERLEDPNKRDYEGNTLLHAAAQSPANNSRIVHLLLERGADVDSANPDGHTPLHFAVYHRKRDAVATLIEAGASVNSKDCIDQTALHLAITEKHWPYCSNSILFHDCDMWIVKMLLRDPDIILDPRDENGDTPLMLAVQEQNLDAVKTLLMKRASANISNYDNRTLLHVVLFAKYPSCDILNLILVHGADIYCEDISRYSPLDILLLKVLANDQDDMLEFAKFFLRLVALKYHIRDCVWSKLKQIPVLYNYFDECFKEVTLMRKRIVCGNVTLHDFLLDCFQTRFGDHLQEIYVPVYEIFKSGVFKIYYRIIAYRLSFSY